MRADVVLARRRAERAALLDRARGFVDGLDHDLGVRAAVVFGSVARGDFNLWSDVDVVVIAERLPDRLLDRLEALDPRPPRVQPVPWTPSDWYERLRRRDPIVVESLERGVWLVGDPSEWEPTR